MIKSFKYHSEFQNLVKVNLFAAFDFTLSNPFCKLVLVFIFGSSYTVQDRWEFIFISTFWFLDLQRSYLPLILINLHFSFFDRLSGVLFLFKALLEWPSGFLSSSLSVRKLVFSNFELRLAFGFSFEHFSELTKDYCFWWYYLMSANLSRLRYWYSWQSLLWLLLTSLFLWGTSYSKR